jgi:hypothetical protein
MTRSLSKLSWITRQLKNQKWREHTGVALDHKTARRNPIHPQSQRLKKLQAPSPSMGEHSTLRANPLQVTKAQLKELKSKRQAGG